MNLAKRLMAGALAITMACGMAACGSSDAKDSGSTSSVAPGKDLNDEQKAIVDALQDQVPDRELSSSEITWLSHYDMNPTEGKVKSPALELFESKFGGKVKYQQTTWGNRYTDLAKSVMANESPDFFPADDMDTFPRGAIKDMFQPIDDYVDLSSDLWADSKSVCDAFMFNGKHYTAALYATPTYACVYNKTTITENGLDDPAELFAEGKWDWDAFTSMCLDFTDAEQDKYALDGYWYNKAISETCGVPMIGLEDGKVVNNMSDPQIEKVQEMMYNLQKNGIVFPRSDNNWKTRGDGANGEGLGSYLTLFIPIGLWAIECPPESCKPFGDIESGEVMFVPMPKDPDSDTHYVSARVHGYNICTGAKNPEGVAAFLDCELVTYKSAEVKQIDMDTLKNEYKWSDEMIEMRDTLYKMAAEHPVYDIQDGVSPDLSTEMQTVSQATMISGGNETTWTACREAEEAAVDYLVKEANNNIASAPTND